VREADFEVPIDRRYFEDYRVGAVHRYGAITVDEAEVIAFATRFDPQYIHVNPEAATRPFGEQLSGFAGSRSIANATALTGGSYAALCRAIDGCRRANR